MQFGIKVTNKYTIQEIAVSILGAYKLFYVE